MLALISTEDCTRAWQNSSLQPSLPIAHSSSKVGPFMNKPKLILTIYVQNLFFPHKLKRLQTWQNLPPFLLLSENVCILASITDLTLRSALLILHNLMYVPSPSCALPFKLADIKCIDLPLWWYHRTHANC